MHDAFTRCQSKEVKIKYRLNLHCLFVLNGSRLFFKTSSYFTTIVKDERKRRKTIQQHSKQTNRFQLIDNLVDKLIK